VTDDAVSGIGNRFHQPRLAFRQRAGCEDISAGASLLEFPHQARDAIDGAVSAVGIRIGVENSCRKRIAHGPNGRNLAFRPDLIGDIQNDGDVAAAGPAQGGTTGLAVIRFNWIFACHESALSLRNRKNSASPAWDVESGSILLRYSRSNSSS
jgi:hypothetical protein